MRILFNSRKKEFKDPFGTLIPEQTCVLHIHIPSSVCATSVACVFENEDGSPAQTSLMEKAGKEGPYDVFRGMFSFSQPGLFFYYFRIHTPSGSFRLFKQGEDTNMEAGDKWQLTCIPADFSCPDWAKGAVIYQIFPDRFCKSGDCDLTGKLQPYTVHSRWDEEIEWQPTPEGLVLNNDFFGGNFRGIAEKMDHLASLGVTLLYLCPIVKSFSNHRYDTGDYKTPDPMLGTMEDFTNLCDAAHAHGIKVVLDGVFNHTGSNSLYFDKNRAFGGNGAYCTPDSPYYSWYDFKEYPDKYTAWWDFDTLPALNNMDPGVIEYIITGEDSVIAHWLRAGCDGFRLDVVDELPPAFVDILKKHLCKLRPDALLMGEVWEDASNKIAYGIRRRYFVDGSLDSIMNYPFRTAILNFLRGRDDGHGIRETVLQILENYPPQVVQCNMNMLGTHDTPRILTTLVDEFDGSRAEKATRFLSVEDYSTARRRLMLASTLQFMLPGSPSIYYADEAGMEGYQDPFNRRTYPWGEEDPILLEHYKALGALRKEQPALRLGDIAFFKAGDGLLGFTRSYGGKKLRICLNRSYDRWEIPGGKVLLHLGASQCAPGWLSVEPMGFCVLEEG